MKYTVQLKNIKFHERLSQETNCFTADLYINKKKVGYVENRGEGGPTSYGANNVECVKIIGEAEKYFASLPKRIVGEYKFDQSLEDTIDCVFEEWLKEKDNAKFKKKLEKDMQKGIVYGTDTAYTIVTWKGFNLAGILNHPKGKRTIQEKINELKSQGHTILNTNLPKDLAI